MFLGVMLDSGPGQAYMPVMNMRATHIPFMKMHGLGNDFVVVDERGLAPMVDEQTAVRVGDRHRGVGFDQLAVMRDSAEADLHLTFFNADGSRAAACGNATRCVARYVMDETGQGSVTIATDHGVLPARDAGDGLTSVNMGHVAVRWDEIPLAHEVDTLHLPIEGGPVGHVDGAIRIAPFSSKIAKPSDLAARGPAIEHHPLFPERTNVQFAHVEGNNRIPGCGCGSVGVGVTLASGSSSCAGGPCCASAWAGGPGGACAARWRGAGTFSWPMMASG